MKTLIIISNSDQYKYMYFYAKSSSNRSSWTFVDRSAMITSLEWSECRQTCKTKFHLKTTFIVYRARYAIPTHAHTNTRATHNSLIQCFVIFPPVPHLRITWIRWHYFSVAVYIQNECCQLWTNDDNCETCYCVKNLLLPVYRCEYCVYVYNNMVIHTRKQTASHTQSPLRSVAGFRIKHFLKLAQRHHTSENGIDDENFVKKAKKSHTR